MHRRSIISGAVVALCLLAVLGLWRWTARSTAPGRIVSPGAPANAPAPAVPQAPASSSIAPTNPPSLPPARVRELSEYRLSNTTRSLDELVRSETAILLENARVDTAESARLAIPDHLRAPGDPGAFIVQSRGPIDARFHARLRGAGVMPVAYLPNNAWLVRGSQAQAQDLAAQPGIQAVLPFEPYFKVKSSLLPLAVEQQDLPAGTCVNLVLFSDAVEATIQAVSDLGAPILARGDSPFGPVIAIQPAADSLAALARLPGVQVIERAGPRVLANDLARVTTGVSLNTITAENYFGLTGTNVLVAIVDSGVDISHPDLSGRVITNSVLAGSDTSGHGTHVAGSIIGSGAASASISAIPSGSVSGADFRGKAPGASLLSLRLGDVSIAGIDDDGYYQEQAARTNARISNMSWFVGGDSDYDIFAASYDAAVRDALPAEPGSQPVLFVFAAGNGGNASGDGLGGSAGSVSSPSTGKNVISVGALEQFRNITNTAVIQGFTNQPWVGGSDSADQVAAYSGRGNVGVGVEGVFGRFKPDLVAPGSWVLSCQASDWNQAAYYSITNIGGNTFVEEVVPPNGLNQYALFVGETYNGLVRQTPISFSITVTPNNLSSNAVTNLPVYVRLADQPTVTTYDAVGINSISSPSDIPLTVGQLYYYAVGNPSGMAVGYTLTTVITYTNNLSDQMRVLKELNDSFGDQYRYESGTSMSAAGVSGILALMQEFYEQRLGLTNSPALMKALLINGARTVSSSYSLQVNPPINHQGWGLARLPTSLPPSSNSVPAAPSSFFFYDQDPTNALATGESHTRLVTLGPAGPSQPLRFTLVWTDPPGNPAAGVKLVNDLDLVVTNRTSGAVYYGNNILAGNGYTSPAESNAPPVLDSVNNVENVIILDPEGTEFSVTVVGRRVNVNAVTAHPRNVAQDYALVISSGDGLVTNAITSITDSGLASGPVDNVTVLTNAATVIPLFNQTAGASSPLIQAVNGVTNQWHFYVLTNYGCSCGSDANYTNAAFITFMPPTLAVPRMGPRSGIPEEISRPEADIDMFVSQDARLTNLEPAVVAGAFRSVGRGGTEIITFSNSVVGNVYYVGIKSEDQMAGQYGFFGAFSDQPFSSLDEDGNLIIYGLPGRAVIPDGDNSNPGVAMVFGIATQPMNVRRVTVTNTVTHQQMGDLVGNLSHNNSFAVLNNHSFGNGFLTQTRIYDDSGQGALGTQRSDGPGSLQNFVSQEAVGLWLLTMLDDAPGSTGQVDSLTIKVEPQDIENGDLLLIGPNSWGYTYVEVPVEATNLTITVVNNSATQYPVELYVRRGSQPDFTNYDFTRTINPPGDSLSISAASIPRLQAGTYFIGIFNPNAIEQEILVRATLELDIAGVVPLVFESTNSVPIIDDAVTRVQVVVTNEQRVARAEVGVVVNHPRVSDLAMQLISPEGTRVLLFENRGGTDTNGLGGGIVTPASLETFYSTDFEDGAGAEWSNTSTDITPIGARQFLGQFGTNIVTLTLTNLPNHTNLVVNFDLFVIRTWDGNWPSAPEGPDIWTLRIAGETNPLLRTTFVVPQASSTQAYPGSYPFGAFPAYTGAFETNTLGYNHPWGFPNNAVYRMQFDFLHTNSTLNLEFLAENLQALTDESWGLDNVSVSVAEIAPTVGYFTFTEDTNKTTTPIKFALPPFTGVGAATATPLNNYDAVADGEYLAGATVDGWRVVANQVSVVNDPVTAQSPTNFLALANGIISNPLATVPGREYTLSFSYRGPGIAGWWRGEGNALDALGINPGTPVGPVTFTNAEVGSGFSFPGTAHISIPANSTLDVGAGTGMTIETWIKPATLSSQQPLVEWNGGTIGAHFWISVSSNNNGGPGSLFANLVDTVGGSHQICSLPGLLATNAYQHVAVTYDKSSGITRLYLNGAIITQTNLGTFNPETRPNLYFGYRPAGVAAGTRYRGVMDEVSIYGRAISPSEIQAIYAAGSAGKFDPVVFPGSAAASLAEATVSAAGSTNTLLGTNSTWQNHSLSFTATDAVTPVQISGIHPGMLLDTFVLRMQPMPLIYLPEESLDAFNGEMAQGTWTLEIWDSRVGATNPGPELVSWNLSLVLQNSQPAAVTAQPFVTFSNTIPAGAFQYLVVEVPPWASAATNYLLGATDLLWTWFNQDATPTGAEPPDTLFFGGPVTNGVVTLVTNGTPPLLPGRSYYLGLQNTNTVAVTFAFRVDFDLTTLTNAISYTSSIPAEWPVRYFQFNVSSNANYVSFDLFDMDGPLNLIASKDAPLPSLQAGYDYGSFNPGLNAESIVVFTNSTPVALSPGPWFLGVLNVAAAPVNFTLLATEYTNQVHIVTLTNMVPYVGSNAAVNDAVLDYYHYYVSPAAARVQFETFGADGDVTLVARKGLLLPDLSSFDFFSANPGTNEELIVVFTNSTPIALTSGDWFITVVNTSGGPVNYSIMASEWSVTGQPITVAGPTAGPNSFCLTWNSLPGVHYVVQGKAALEDPQWLNASPTITANDYLTTYCVPLPSPFHFFRVREGFAYAPPVPPVPLQHAQPVTVAILPGQMLSFSVAVPDWAQAATNILTSAGDPVDLWFSQTGLPTGTNAGDLMLLTNVVDGTVVLDGASTPALVSAQTYYLGVQNTNAMPVFVTLGVEFDIVILTNAVPYLDGMPAAWSSRPFQFDVSSNAQAVAFDLFGLDGDLDLVVRRSLPLPSLTSFDYASIRPGTQFEDVIVLPGSQPVALSAGRWYLSVRNPALQAVNYTVRATEFTGLPAIITLTNAVPYTNSNSGVGIEPSDFYHYHATTNANRLQFETLGTTADITLVARRGLLPPTLGSYDYRSAIAGANDELIVVITNSVPVTFLPGDWFITVVNTSGGPANYAVMATDWPNTARPLTVVGSGPVGGDYCITWNSLPGVHYFVRGKINLADPAWANLSGPIIATNTVTTWCIPRPTPYQFFQIVEGLAPVISVPPAVITGYQVTPAGVVLSWYGPIDARYQVQWTDSLTPPAWTNFTGIVTSTNGFFTYTDDGSETGGFGLGRFYRVLSVP